MKFVNAKAGKISVMDAFAISAAKMVTEKTLAPLVGNGTLMSGGLKIAGALALDSFVGNNKLGQYASAGMIIDGSEDIVMNLLGSTLGVSSAPAVVRI